ncbi:hypothetical protein C8R45DRAFT_1006736, partial [Mycena sanguinolenta]
AAHPVCFGCSLFQVFPVRRAGFASAPLAVVSFHASGCIALHRLARPRVADGVGGHVSFDIDIVVTSLDASFSRSTLFSLLLFSLLLFPSSSFSLAPIFSSTTGRSSEASSCSFVAYAGAGCGLRCDAGWGACMAPSVMITYTRTRNRKGTTQPQVLLAFQKRRVASSPSH